MFEAPAGCESEVLLSAEDHGWFSPTSTMHRACSEISPSQKGASSSGQGKSERRCRAKLSIVKKSPASAHRHVAFSKPSHRRFDSESPLLKSMIDTGWAHLTFRRYWNYGYHKDSILSIFIPLPEAIRSVIHASLDFIEACSTSNTERLQRPDRLMNPSGDDFRGATHQMLKIDDKAWDEIDNVGVIVVNFDPSSQRRTYVSMNSGAARIFNLRKDDLLNLYANFEVPLALTELDALRIFCVDLHCAFIDCMTFNYRIVVGTGQNTVCKLVCSTVNKVRSCIRVISAREYDEALRRAPGSCPLALMGDFRSGQELLYGAKSDLRLTIQSLARSIEGQSIFRDLADKVYQLRNKLYASGQIPGSPAHLVESGPSFLNPSLGDISIPIPHPLAYSRSVCQFDQDNAALTLMVRQWAKFAVRRLWNAGYQSNHLVQLFNAIPPRLVSAIGNIFIMLHRAKTRISEVKRSFQGVAICEEQGLTMVADPDQIRRDEEAIWEEEERYGYLRFDWDAVTQRRKYVAINSGFARFFGMHKEELLTRIANHEMWFESQEDFLCTFLHRLSTDLLDGTVQYVRMIVTSGRSVRATLACITSKKEFNDAGEVKQGKHMFRAISPEEYDDALQRTPELCPLVLIGDRRGGRQLLADADADSQRSIATLVSTRRGRATLDRLAANIEAIVARSVGE